MRILDKKEIQVLNSLLIEDLPFSVFEIIRKNSKISESRIIGEIIDIFPSTINVQKIRRLCTSMIHWFVHNGDITNVGNRNYRILPPYGIYSGKHEIVLKLHGDISISEFRQRFEKSKDIKFKTILKKWPWEGHESVNIGFQSFLYFNRSYLEYVISILGEFSISLVSANDICLKLPKIDDLLIPPKSSFNIDFPRWGVWLGYNPSIIANKRWTILNEISTHPRGLLKWQPNSDWRGENSKRYFFNNNHGKYAELSESTAILWTYYLDFEETNPRNILIGNDFICTPYELPNSYIQWLHVISSDWYGEGDYKKFFITRYDEVLNILENNLKLRGKIL